MFFVALDDDKDIKPYKNVNVKYFKKDKIPIKVQIQNFENEIKQGKHKQNNLIVLAGARLQLGISLNNVDIVVLWNNIMSSDAIFQMLFVLAN